MLNNNQTVSTAESCTGGKVASMITSVPGSSAWYKGSVVAYDNNIKTQVLGVNPEIIETFGAVSEETAIQMANNIRRIFGTDYSVSLTGIAGPTGGNESKPVGTVWIAISSPKGTFAEKHCFGDNRQINIFRFCRNSLKHA